MDILETMMEEALEATLSTENNTEEVAEETIEESVETTTEEQEDLIKLNAESLLVDESTSRFSSAIWYDAVQKSTVLLAGVGGIGSYVSLLIARMHPAQLVIYDPDKVEIGNMSGQLHSVDFCGEYKTTSCAYLNRTIGYYFNTCAFNKCYNECSRTQDIMICGFDNMEARKVFFEKWVKHVSSKPEHLKSECLFIDGRLSAEEYQVLCIKGDDVYNMERYRKDFLFSDNEADETICSYKQTTFMANMIASTIVNLFVNYVANQCNPLIDRDLPFFTTYNAETMFFKTEL